MERLAGRIAEWFKINLNLNQDDTEVAAYALTTIFVTTATFCLLIVLTFLAGVIPEGLVVIGTIAWLRTVSGGAHLTSPWRCVFISALIPTIFGFIAKIGGPLLVENVAYLGLFFLFSTGIFIIYRYAPADVPEKPIRPERRGIYRRLSFLMVGIWLGITAGFLYFKINSLFIASLAGFSWQVLSITPAGFGLCRFLSNIKFTL